LVAEHFRKLGGKVREQTFSGRDPESGEALQYVNLMGSWYPERKERILLAAHYDTRPYPDREIDPNLQRETFLGANDGASGVALLMEIAHHLETLEIPERIGVDLVLFDAEERVYGPQANLDDYFLGSKHFARNYRSEQRRGAGSGSSRYVAGLILDMIADKDLEIPQEGFSLQLQPRLVREVWDVARRVDAKAFTNRPGTDVSDDHLPLNDAGIPTIDLIDFDYPHWHRASDTPEQCSAASLEQVGRVVTAWLTLPRGRISRQQP
jgi:Zn-dependent M28 family amino/carboxypeptidase